MPQETRQTAQHYNARGLPVPPTPAAWPFISCLQKATRERLAAIEQYVLKNAGARRENRDQRMPRLFKPAGIVDRRAANAVGQ